MILCSEPGCNQPHYRLLILDLRTREIYDWNKQRHVQGLCGTYKAMCRDHYRHLVQKGLVKFAGWKGKLFNIKDGTFKCSNSRCQFSATHFYWRGTLIPPTSLPASKFGYKSDEIHGIEYCEFHSDEAIRGITPSPLLDFQFIPVEHYRHLFLKHIMEQ